MFIYIANNVRFVASENKLDSEDFSPCRRFAASGAMTAEEQEQRVLYANVLEYEQDHVSAGRDVKCNIVRFYVAFRKLTTETSKR